MKKTTTGVIILDAFDIICLSFAFGATLAYFKQKKKQKNSEDPLVAELKRRSPLVIPVNVDGTPMEPIELPLIRGGDNQPIKGISLTIKNKRLARLIFGLIQYAKKRKELKLLQAILVTLNTSLTTNFAFRFAAGGSLNHIQILLLFFPSSVAGYMIQQAISNPLVSIVGPLGLILGPGIEYIPEEDPIEQCKLLCKYIEQYQNNKFMIEMKKLNPAIKSAPVELKFPFECVEERLSIIERFKLRRIIENQETRKQVQYFREFIKKFPQCDADSEAVYKDIVDVAEKIRQ